MIKKILKVLLAGICAIILLSFFLCFYSLTPIHIENKNENTDYVWEPNSYWVNTNEGISFGKYDNNGFNNLSVIENPDILLLGSSHMEATFISQDRTIASLLNNLFDHHLTCYNMGISGHDFYKVCQYLEKNMQLYPNSKYVVIETTDLDLDSKKVDKIIHQEISKTPSYSSKLMVILQKIPFIRHLYLQYSEGLKDVLLDKQVETNKEKEIIIDENAYEELFIYLEKLSEEYQKDIMIFYHPTEQLQEDGTISFIKNPYQDIFEEYANKHQITFLSLEKAFDDLYQTKHQLPHGFSNTKIGFGHLNQYGHQVIADQLYKIILEKEEIGHAIH